MDELLEAWYAAHDHPMKHLAPEREAALIERLRDIERERATPPAPPRRRRDFCWVLQGATGVVLELFELAGRLLAAAIGPGIKAFGDGLSVVSAKVSNGRYTAM